ncbi:MAG TPA: hypothetical protein VNX23_00775 [Bradyrhizobium sp.]|uniref:hypothetical protein n=1 Tax=Bradyrhizobium sp. TaxID=376 RepID=UPI002CFB214B|nr:hypothetical protein [Bradyrhizobium sp.]HXB75936.1 hypothetical protein [Bradyrhizobium sp.]
MAILSIDAPPVETPSGTGTPAISAIDVTKRYGAVSALEGLTLEGSAAARSSACSAPTVPAKPP